MPVDFSPGGLLLWCVVTGETSRANAVRKALFPGLVLIPTLASREAFDYWRPAAACISGKGIASAVSRMRIGGSLLSLVGVAIANMSGEYSRTILGGMYAAVVGCSSRLKRAR